MAECNTGKYNLREKPKRTEKARETSTERGKTKRTTEERESFDDEPGTDRLVETRSETGEKTIEIEEPDRDISDRLLEDNFERGDASSNPNTETGGKSGDANQMILLMLQQMHQKMEQQSQKMEQQSEKMERQNSQIQEKMEQQSQQQSQQVKEGQKIMLEEVRKVEKEIGNLKVEIQAEINKQITASSEVILNAVENRFIEWESRWEEKQQNLKSQCINETVEICQNVRETTYKKIDNVNEDVSKNRKEIEKMKVSHQEGLQRIDVAIQDVKSRSEQHDAKIKEIEDNTVDLRNQIEERMQQGSLQMGKEQVHVYYTGGESSEVRPRFSGKEKNPMEFLEQLRRYIQRLSKRREFQDNNYDEVIEKTLVDHAARWWQMVKDDVGNFKEFEDKFTNKYWNTEIQRGVRRRMELETYRANGKFSRAEYFIDKALILKNMNPTMEEGEIVSFLSEHYSERIRDGRRVQNINTIEGFESLLNSEDIEERNRSYRIRNMEMYGRKDDRQENRREEYQKRSKFNGNMRTYPRWEDRRYENNRQSNWQNRNYPPRTYNNGGEGRERKEESRNTQNYNARNYSGRDSNPVCQNIVTQRPDRELSGSKTNPGENSRSGNC